MQRRGAVTLGGDGERDRGRRALDICADEQPVVDRARAAFEHAERIVPIEVRGSVTERGPRRLAGRCHATAEAAEEKEQHPAKGAKAAASHDRCFLSRGVTTLTSLAQGE